VDDPEEERREHDHADRQPMVRAPQVEGDHLANGPGRSSAG
jgi:hypothetical protein